TSAAETSSVRRLARLLTRRTLRLRGGPRVLTRRGEVGTFGVKPARPPRVSMELTGGSSPQRVRACTFVRGKRSPGPAEAGGRKSPIRLRADRWASRSGGKHGKRYRQAIVSATGPGAAARGGGERDRAGTSGTRPGHVHRARTGRGGGPGARAPRGQTADTTA